MTTSATATDPQIRFTFAVIPESTVKRIAALKEAAKERASKDQFVQVREHKRFIGPSLPPMVRVLDLLRTTERICQLSARHGLAQNPQVLSRVRAAVDLLTSTFSL